MKKYNLSALMKKAWSLFRKAARKKAITFSEALKKAWAWLKASVENRIKAANTAKALGIEEEVHTWAGWQSLGRPVKHESKAVFQMEADDPTTKTGKRVKSYFILSQTEAGTAVSF